MRFMHNDSYLTFDGNVYFYSEVDKLPNTKENAFIKGMAMFCRSWTFEKLTAKEKESCVDSFLWAYEQGAIKGTFADRILIMHAIYTAFLFALGYNDGALSWRDEGEST